MEDFERFVSANRVERQRLEREEAERARIASDNARAAGEERRRVAAERTEANEAKARRIGETLSRLGVPEAMKSLGKLGIVKDAGDMSTTVRAGEHEASVEMSVSGPTRYVEHTYMHPEEGTPWGTTVTPEADSRTVKAWMDNDGNVVISDALSFHTRIVVDPSNPDAAKDDVYRFIEKGY